MEEILKLFFDNKEWILNNVILVIFFVFIFVLYKIISLCYKYFTKEDKVVNNMNGKINVNVKENNGEINIDNSTHITKKSSNKIDYSAGISVCNGFIAPNDGRIEMEADSATLYVNGHKELTVRNIHAVVQYTNVIKGDLITIVRNCISEVPSPKCEVIFYPFKEENSDD